MSTKNKLGCAVGVIGLFVTTPIWYYLLYQVLTRVEATETMWLLFWIYLPVHLLVAVVSQLIVSAFADK